MKKEIIIKDVQIIKNIKKNMRYYNYFKLIEKWFQKNNFTNRLIQDCTLIFLKDENNRTIGVVSYDIINKNKTFVYLIYLSYRYRGKGLLKEILNKVPGKKLEWEVSIKNTNAIIAYLKIGATIKRTNKNYCNCLYKKQKEF
mgnify:CR=1 FL=1